MLALLGLLAVAGYQNRDRIGDFLGQLNRPNGNPDPGLNPDGTPRPGGIAPDSPLGNILGGLGGLFGGANLDNVKGGLSDLFERFTGTGHDREARSWVETGPNQQIAATDLEDALGADTIDALVSQTGLSREELLSRLQAVLPSAVDKLTPEGRLPT
jgi:uncharacterized protein YidB (DUF937 family)